MEYDRVDNIPLFDLYALGRPVSECRKLLRSHRLPVELSRIPTRDVIAALRYAVKMGVIQLV